MSILKQIMNSKKGQTVIETIAMLLVLLTILFMIAEFARAWYLKNSLNNAARVGARVAVVAFINTTGSNPIIAHCSTAGSDPKNPIDAACGSPGVPHSPSNDTTVALTVDDTINDGKASQGEKVTLKMTADFKTVLPRLLPFMTNTVVAEASMRHE
jgi:Flp pilus assembly protein TadG